MENNKQPYVPPLFFSRRWKRDMLHKKPNLDGLAWIDRENVVMHISMKQLTTRSFLRVATGAHSKFKKTNRKYDMKTLSGADLDSPFSHLRINTERDGKILKFEKNQNLIRGIVYHFILLFLAGFTPYLPLLFHSSRQIFSQRRLCFSCALFIMGKNRPLVYWNCNPE